MLCSPEEEFWGKLLVSCDFEQRVCGKVVHPSDHHTVAVSTASCIHLCLAVWFIYMALAYHIMPEPSWFPNTTSIGISAVKTWLYYPMAGHFLMAVRWCVVSHLILLKTHV